MPPGLRYTSTDVDKWVNKPKQDEPEKVEETRLQKCVKWTLILFKDIVYAALFVLFFYMINIVVGEILYFVVSEHDFGAFTLTYWSELISGDGMRFRIFTAILWMFIFVMWKRMIESLTKSVAKNFAKAILRD